MAMSQSVADAAMAPTTWTRTYGMASRTSNFRAAASPIVMAGLK